MIFTAENPKRGVANSSVKMSILGISSFHCQALDFYFNIDSIIDFLLNLNCLFFNSLEKYYAYLLKCFYIINVLLNGHHLMVILLLIEATGRG